MVCHGSFSAYQCAVEMKRVEKSLVYTLTYLANTFGNMSNLTIQVGLLCSTKSDMDKFNSHLPEGKEPASCCCLLLLSITY